MNIKYVSIVFLAISLLSACDDIKTKLHLMANQDEQQCLDSEKLNFKDPDVLFVANLGDRGLGAISDGYWVRYKAKNSYGAYIQGNMYCVKNKISEKWSRDANFEYLKALGLSTILVSKDTDQIINNPGYKSRFSNDYDHSHISENALNAANEIIFTSADDLADHFRRQ